MTTISLPHRRRALLQLARPAAALLALGLVAGCAAVPGGGNDKDALLQRATAYWKAIKDNDRVTAWNYEEVSKKQGATLQGYVQRGGLVFDEAQVLGVNAIEGERAKVNVVVSYALPAIRLSNKQAELQDEWVRIDGQWYHAHRPSFQ